MPLYTDQSYYYSSGSSQLYAPYYTPGLYGTSSSSSSYAPYSSTYNRTFGGSYTLPLTPPRSPTYTSTHSLASRYQPKLSTITETSPLISSRHGGILPLTRIQSPKIFPYAATSATTTKYVPPRPIPINTADIDVSSKRYPHHRDVLEKEKHDKQDNEIKRNSKENNKKEKSERNKEEGKNQEKKGRSSTIKRDRPVVRLSTIRSRSKDRNRNTKSTTSSTDDSPEPKSKIFKDLPTIEPLHPTETHISWRQKLAEELATEPTNSSKKSPGDLIRERYLIQEASSDNLNKSQSQHSPLKDDNETKDNLAGEVIIEMDLDSTNNSIRRLSIPQCPTFHDICEDISSDKIDDDLNAGELRRRASLIQEQEQEILNKLQKSASGTFQLIHLERRDSHDSAAEEGHRQSTKKRTSKKGKKIRHKITAVVEVENSPILPVLQEKDELSTTTPGKDSSIKPKFTFNVESVEEHHEIHKVFKLPKRKSVKNIMKSREVTLPEGFMQASPKAKIQPKAKSPTKTGTFISTAEIFTFEPSSVDSYWANKDRDNLEAIVSPKFQNDVSKDESSSTTQSPESPKLTISETTASLHSTSDNQSTNLKELVLPIKIKIETTRPSKIELPKVLPTTVKETKQNPIEKSDSGIDFWSEIGNRESVYMTNRKKGQLESQWQKCEELLESQAVEDVSNIKEIKSAVTAQKNEALKKADQDMAKANDKGVVGRSQSTESTMSDKVTKGQNNLNLLGKTEQQAITKNSTANAHKSLIEQKCKTENLATTPTTSSLTAATTATSAATKINSGQAAKSPAQQPNKFTTLVKNDNESNIKIDKAKLFISQTDTKTTKTQTQLSTTPKSITTSANRNLKEAKLLPEVNEPQANGAITEARTTSSIGESCRPEIKVVGQNEALSAITTTVPLESTESTSSTVSGTKPKTTPKAIAAKEKSIATTVAKSKASPRSEPATPINADQFISIAPPKTTTSPTKTKTTSPQNIKTKAKATITINKDVNEKVAKTKISPKTTTVTATSPITIASTPEVATTAAVAITATTSSTTKLPVSSSTKSSTSPETSTAAIVSPIVVATESVACRKSHEDADDDKKNPQQKAHAPNNLSKFATVQNLAQCLQDVDADLEDYIPSSAENSDDEDSSYNYSSADGCDYQNLSASMKKKLRQRRKKEKQAEQARFDPQKKIKIDPSNKCYVKEEAPRYPLVATPRPLWKREKPVYPDEDSDDESGDSEESGSGSEETEDSEECTTSEEYEDDLSTNTSGALTGSSNLSKENSAIIRLSTCSNDSGFEGGTAPSSPKKMLECDVNCHKKCEHLMANLCGVNQKLIVEALACVKRGAREARESSSTPPSSNPAYTIETNEEQDETSYTYSQFQKLGRFTAPATVIPRFKNYSVDDFHFLAVLGKGSFGKVLLAELRDTTYYYAVKCLKKDVVLEDDDVDSTLIERKVLALGTKHPYLCHLFCTFQTESHLFFVMEYLNGGDLMFHIQESGRFPEERARFYGAEIISGLKFLHKKGIIYRDLKLDNVLLDFEGHVRIADFGMCKLQIYLDKTADSFCGTPDYMAPEIIKGEKYNQNVDWWSFGVLLYEMLIGQSPFSGCDEDELFWSICNEIPWFPVYISAEATGILKGLLEKDYTKRIGSQYSPAGDISEHLFFRPIDWDLLEKRLLPPPYKPLVKHPLDTQYFDRVFTKERVRLTPIEKDILHSMDQKPFLGFTYTNPHITLD
ncbi:uncharacterized protein Pkcdelta isoform X1 [Bactrocera oleae]|uniref:uncharacterized protein Pkcdelta isoform X1 n=1 Tax=Bactrocera oleae TaxID=104688 RepID=UPI00387E24F8